MRVLVAEDDRMARTLLAETLADWGYTVREEANGMSALAVLLECQRLARGWGKGFAVKGAPAKLNELARLYGVGEVVGVLAKGSSGP